MSFHLGNPQGFWRILQRGCCIGCRRSGKMVKDDWCESRLAYRANHNLALGEGGSYPLLSEPLLTIRVNLLHPRYGPT